MAKPRITQTTPYDSPGLWFFDAKNLDEITTGSPPTGAQNKGGVVSNGDFRSIFCYISETVQNSDIVTMKR